ncbi:MAG: FAD binding domain-containing protein [Gemmatimonadales bacterium]
MEPFRYHRPASADEALREAGPGAAFLAGGTELVPWLKDGIARPADLIDIGGLGLSGVRRDGDVLRIGAATRLAEVATHPAVRAELPALVTAIDEAASVAVRHQGSLAGNLLQAPRCPYFRAAGAPAGYGCELRAPGSGCAARSGDARSAAIFPGSHPCIAVQPSDPAVVLALLGAELTVRSAAGSRVQAIESLYHAGPRVGVIEPDELITEIVVTLGARARSARFGKVRDRASFDFALVSAAVTRSADGPEIVVGGVAWGPRRCRTAEAALTGQPLGAAAIRAALDAEFAGAEPRSDNAFKRELAIRLVADLLAETGR